MAGFVYGLAIFALGFALGTLRELVLAPLVGRDVVVWIEAPLLLLASWFAAGALVGRFHVPRTPSARLAMGAAAFALLMTGEALVGVFGFNRTLAMHLSAYLTPRGALELLPQIAFALFPLLHLIREPLP